MEIKSKRPIIDLLKEALDQGLTVFLEGDNLKMKKAKNSKLDPKLIDLLKSQKEEITEFLKKEGKNFSRNGGEQSKISSTQWSATNKRPLSFSQERLWFINKFSGSTNYHIPAVLKLSGALDLEMLENAFNVIINRHEVLRGVYMENEGTPTQLILPENVWKMEYTANRLPDPVIRTKINEMIQRPFDLTKDHMLRARVFKKSEEEFILVLVVHHIAADAWSKSVLVKELIEVYNAKKENRDLTLPALSIQYADYAAWERKAMSGDNLAEKLSYWENKLSDVTPLDLRLGHQGRPENTKEGAVVHQHLDVDLSQKITALAKQKGATFFMLLLSVYKVLLYRYTGQNDICVGTSLANRSHKELEPMIGFFVKLLALRSDVNSEISFSDFLNEVKKTTLDGMDHKEAPFHEIVQMIDKGRTTNRNPIFQTLFVLHNTLGGGKELGLNGVKIEQESSGQVMTHFDIGFYITESPTGLSIAVNYFKDMFDQPAMEQMLQHYVNLLEAVVQNPNQSITELQLLNEAEQQELIKVGNQVNVAYPKNSNLTALFEAQAENNPETAACIFGQTTYTYKELNEKANQLAYRLQKEYKVGNNDLVGIMADQPQWQLVAILATLKAGAAYVPIDPELPASRKSFIAKDTQFKVLMTGLENTSEGFEATTVVLSLEQHFSSTQTYPVKNIKNTRSADSLAYLIYTSGTTGTAKGVMVSDANLMDYVYGLDAKLDIGAYNTFGLMSTMTADLGNTVLYGALLTGGSVHLFQKEQLSNSVYLQEYFQKNKIDCIKIVPSHWKALSIEGKDLLTQKMIVFGGESLGVDVLERIKNQNDAIQVVNHYGPTEGTIGKLLYQVDLNKEYKVVPIGQPFSNSTAYVVDQDFNLCPTGVSGELLLGGEGISSGYWNQPALTDEKFVTPTTFNTSSKVYRTGDLVRRLPNGDIEFMGRVDDQVKIRGYRVELNGVATMLDTCEAVQQSVVIAQDTDSGTKRLVAYIVPNNTFDAQEIRTQMESIVPDYMIPTVFVPMDEIPLTRNGKVNKKALPDPDANITESLSKEAPRNELEEKLMAIWSDLLKLENIGIHDNFFEIGGHSLIAIRVVLAIRKQLDTDLEIKTLFENRTIASLAEFINSQKEEDVLPPITAQERPENIPLSFSQERLWIVDQLTGSTNYHIDIVQRFSKDFDTTVLAEVLETIIDRHEILRTIIRKKDGKPYQTFLEAKDWRLDFEKVDAALSAEEIKALVAKEIYRPFDLDSDFMIRTKVFRLADETSIVVMVIHHIAGDVWSRELLNNELKELYLAKIQNRTPELPKVDIQYADYAIWQNENFNEERLQEDLTYWSKQLENLSPLNLPTDFTRPRVQSNEGEVLRFGIEKEQKNAIFNMAKKAGVTPFMFLLTIFKTLMYRYSGQNDICIGTPIANRSQQELEGLMGFFLNSLALRSKIDGTMNFKDLLEQVKNTTIDAFGRQEAPFEKIVGAVDQERDMSRSPLFQVWFDFHDTGNIRDMNTSEYDELEALLLPNVFSEDSYCPSKFDIDMMAIVLDDGMQFKITYNTTLFKQETVERMQKHFLQIMTSILENQDQKIGAINILTEAETTQIVTGFNNTTQAYPWTGEKNVLQLFNEQVNKNPDATAVTYGDKTMTYQELDIRSNQAAQYLKTTYELKADDFIGVMMNRSDWLMVSILAVLKAGAAYVPVDMDYPLERKQFIVEDTKMKTLIIDSSSILEVTELNVPVVSIDIQSEDFEMADNFTNAEIKNSDLAYVIYTSGSTGNPKGVMIEHSSLTNYIAYGLNNYNKGIEAFNFPLFTSIAFDLTQTSIFLSLLSGGGVYIEETEEIIDLLQATINNPNVNIIKLTPSHVKLIEGMQNPAIKKVIVGGEALENSHVEILRQVNPDIEIFNEYGPTEATIGCTVQSVGEVSGTISIGAPVWNTQVFVLDQQQQVVPVGVPGELCIAGAGLARAYLNRPELTAEKFVEVEISKGQTTRVYRSGDAAKWLADGTLEYMGRIDNQVKINGYRIEPGEIEAVLNAYESIEQSVVVAKSDDNDHKRLYAYIVGKENFDITVVQTQIKASLPEYMIPAFWTKLEEMPMTTNGKIDRKSLAALEVNQQADNNYVAPRNEVEEKLVEIWTALLPVDRIGVFDNFFELGGDSIISIQLVHRARKIGFHLQAKDVFEYPTIAALSEQIENSTENRQTEQGILSGPVPLSPIQNWFLETEITTRDKFHFNQAQLFSVEKGISENHLSKIVKYLMAHHDALRFEYIMVNGEWTQEYGSKEGQLEIATITDQSKENYAEKITDVCNTYQTSMNIEKGELCKFVLIKTPDHDSHNRFFIVVHHLAIDGVSWRIILEQIHEALDTIKDGAAIDFGEKGTSYRQWVDAQHEYVQSSLVDSERSYWRSVIKEYEPLPTDKKMTNKPAVRESFVVELDEALTSFLIQDANRAYHTEINDLLLSALAQTICNWSESPNLVVGMEGHGREYISEDIDVSSTVGWFTSIYPVLVKIQDEYSLGDLVKTVKEQLREVPQKGFGFGMLKYLHPSREVRNQMAKGRWDIVFNYLGQTDNVIEVDSWLEGAQESAGVNISPNYRYQSKFELNSIISGGKLRMNWKFSGDQYEKETIQELAQNFMFNLAEIIRYCKAVKEPEYTPSDFRLTDIGAQEFSDYRMSKGEDGLQRKNTISGHYNLGPLQEGLLFHHLSDDLGNAYIEQLSVDLPEGVEVEVLRDSFNHVLRNHSVLRTSISYKEFSRPILNIHKEAEVPFEVIDFTNYSKEEQEERVANFIQSDVEQGFDLSSCPLMRVTLLKLEANFYKMVWTHHHMILDGWSNSILVAELLSTYENYVQGKQPDKQKEDRYEDFLEYIDKQDSYQTESFWKDYLKGISGGTMLPFVKKTGRKSDAEVALEESFLMIPKEMTSKIKDWAQQNQVTINTVVQGMWAMLLGEYTGQPDVSFGVTVSGRPTDLENAESRVGLFINAIPLRTQIDKDTNLATWLGAIQKGHTEAREFQYSPLNEVQQWAGLKGEFFDNILVFENYPIADAIAEDERQLKTGDVSKQRESSYPLTIQINLGDTIKVEFSYNKNRLDTYHVENIKGHLFNLLEQLIDPETTKVSDLRPVSRVEESLILHSFNNTECDYPNDKTIVELFEAEVRKNPNQPAIIFGKESFSYQELDELSDRLAFYLQNNYDLQRDDMIGIMMDRSKWMAVSMLGIMKAGCAYVPIDIDYPLERKSFIMEDTQLKALIIESGSMFDVMEFSVPILSIDIQIDDFEAVEKEQLQSNVQPSDLAYVIYTSGSTGIPKGVMVEHSGFINMSLDQIRQFEITAEDNVLQFASMSFDASVSEIFMALLAGAGLVMISKKDISNPERFTHYLQKNKVTVATLPPAYLNALNRVDLDFLRVLITAGEAAIPADAVYYANQTTYFNAFGPSECSVCVSMYKVSPEDDSENAIPVGKPIANTEAFILDKELRVVSVGVAGEICISGPGLSRGYLNRPELTAERFIAHPYKPGERLYRTGDIGYWDKEGNIIFGGRQDNQIKLRGYRIELGEIENALRANPDIDDAVVVTKNEGVDKKLVAYYKPTKKVELWPSIAEFFIYDDVVYRSMYTHMSRNQKYRDAINKVVEGKTVLEIGPGPELVLSRICLDCGADHIYAVEILEETYLKARKCINRLGLQDKITLIHGDILEVELSEKVDYCVSEIVGSIGGSEGSAVLIDSAKKFLKNPANMIPSRSTTKIAMVELDESEFEYGFSDVPHQYTETIMNEFGAGFEFRLCLKDLPAKNIISNHDVFEDLDYSGRIYPEIDHQVRLEVNKAACFNGFYVWMDLFMNETIHLDIVEDPGSWLPIFFPVAYPGIDVEKGDYVDLTISRKLSANDINPDFFLKGNVHKQDGTVIPVYFDSYHHKHHISDNPFYNKLFDDGHARKLEKRTPEQLKGTLGQYLPEYMIPDNIIELNEFPLNLSGKVDKNALPDINPETLLNENFIAPRNEMEERLAEIWCELLGLERVGVYDNFFNLGGHSLMATRMVGILKHKLSVEVRISTLFEYPTISELYSFIRVTTKKEQAQEEQQVIEI